MMLTERVIRKLATEYIKELLGIVCYIFRGMMPLGPMMCAMREGSRLEASWSCGLRHAESHLHRDQVVALIGAA
jgi:hypothetical protein